MDLCLAQDGVALPLKEPVSRLGFLLDSQLLQGGQLVDVVQRAFVQLRLVHQLQPYQSDLDLAMVDHALVSSCLDYCNTLYMGLPLKMVQKLQLDQNVAACVVLGLVVLFSQATAPLAANSFLGPLQGVGFDFEAIQEATQSRLGRPQSTGFCGPQNGPQKPWETSSSFWKITYALKTITVFLKFLWAILRPTEPSGVGCWPIASQKAYPPSQ